nr:Flp family type IVb pilin [Methylobacterium crusticola]
MDTLRRFLADESGATVFEYTLGAALIVLVVFGAATMLGKDNNTSLVVVAKY